MTYKIYTLGLLAFSLSISLVFTACGGRQSTTGNSQSGGQANEVTIYVSTDRVFSEPILRA